MKTKQQPARRLTDEQIDRYFAQASATIKEVERNLEGVCTINCLPRGVQNMRLR